ncbi:Putative metallo-hydrolase YycJ [Sporomusa silvacetica DSM 10669]|uniref:Metallo-hydrolase YycJ n=1 Tax=Sporomusa silvacetica DSM 10669 TaxID=1123289 RepID=A0ABZ3II73_9FIRM|nr:MBL fold metallo-hydrolase [Sporomusa silvacetica]OZC21549.1 putative metallo-hydrolase YycJ [Sporomusa silvacetica DSM 10669]
MNIEVLASSSAGNAYKVSDGNTDLLLDAGLSYKELQRRLNFQVSSLAAILISHSHKDHCKAVPNLLKTGIDVYMSQQTADQSNVSGHRVKVIEPLKQYKIGSWTVLPFELEHDVTNLGYLLANKTGEKLLYATDTYYCKYKFKGLTHVLIECNHSYDILAANVENGSVPVEHKNRLIRSHFSLENVKEFLKANDLSMVREIYLIHLSSGNSDAGRFKREIAELTGKMIFVAEK